MLAQNQNVTAEQREEGLIWPAYADSMIGHKRLDNLQFCIETVLEERIPGDFIETGVWRGGSCIFMRGALAAYQVTDRRVFVADSFAACPSRMQKNTQPMPVIPITKSNFYPSRKSR